MATKKKPTAKGVKKAAAAKRPSASRSRSSSTAQSSAIAELRVTTKAIELQVICLTVLSVIFAAMAFWRYG